METPPAKTGGVLLLFGLPAPPKQLIVRGIA